MTDIENKEESWVRKLPKIILVLAALIFVIIVIRDHNQYTTWKEDQSDLTDKVRQTSEELALLREANGTLDDVKNNVESLQHQAADMTAALGKLTEEKNTVEIDLSKLRQELNYLNGKVSAGKNRVAELVKERGTLQSTNQQLREDIVNKKRVLDSITFLQRQKPKLEQNIQDLKTRYDLAVKTERDQQTRLEDLQKKIKEKEAEILSLSERSAALNSEVSEMIDVVKKLSLQREKLETWDDHQKNLEYIEYLQQQKESLEMSINSLLELGKKLEEENPELQQNDPTP